MKKNIQEVVESSLCIPMTEDEAKRMLSLYNKALKRSNNPKARALWEYGEKNLESLAKDFVKQRCEDILENESNW